MKHLLKNITILDATSKYHQKKVDMLIEKQHIIKIDKHISDDDAKIYDYDKHFISLGFCDLVTQICDPGFEQRDSIETIAKSAIAGGFTAICAMPNNQPITQHKTNIQYILNKAQNTPIQIFPIAALTQNFDGKTPTEMLDLNQAGAIAFSDIPNHIKTNDLLARALQYTQQFGGLVMEMPFDKNLVADACIHESEVSVRLGLKGIPNVAEYIAVYQAIEILKYTGGNLHLTGISCKESIALIQQAKLEKLSLTASCFVHHLVSTEDAISNYNSNFKVFPPLRTSSDKEALVQAVKDGIIDAIATQHTPLESELKYVEFEYASFGMLGLETAFGLLLQYTDIPIERIVDALSTQPRNIVKQNNTIEENKLADFVIFNATQTWIFEENGIQSLSKNTAYIGAKMKGKIKALYTKGNFILNG